MAKLLNEKELVEALALGGGANTNRAGTGSAMTRTAAANTAGRSGTTGKVRAGKTNLPSLADAGMAASDTRETARAASAYYTRPELGTKYETLEAAITTAKAAAEEKLPAYTAAKTTLEEAQEGLDLWSQQIQVIQNAYYASPSEEGADLLNRARSQMESMLIGYMEAESSFNAAAAEYEPLYSTYERAMKQYSAYAAQQQRLYTDWKNTIRDTDTVAGEIAATDSYIAQLEEKANSLNTLTRFRNDALGQTMRADLEQVQNELAQAQAARALLQEEQDWSTYYRYADLKDAEDFEELSRYATTANGKDPALNALSGTYTETGFDDLTYDYINRNEEAKGKAMVNSVGDNTALLGLDTGYLGEMTDDEVGIFNYLYATQGADAAYEYTAYLAGDLNARQRAEQQAQWAKYAEEHPVASSAFSVLTSPAKGLSYLGQAADYLSDGQIDQNAAYNKFSYIPGAIRGQVSRQIEESGKWGEVGSFAYQTGMSMADFLLNAAVTGGNQTLSLAIMGTGAAADATIEAKDRGLTDDQAFALGTVAGLAEVITEKVSLETLLNPDLLKEGSLKYILKNMLAEGSEEVGSDAINLIADIIVSKDQSQWRQSVDAYMAEGRTEAEAFGLAVRDQAITMGLDFLGGAISGGVMSTAGAAVYNYNTGKLSQELELDKLSDEDRQAIIDTGLESGENTAAHQIAQELQKKAESGEEITGNELARLYQANVQAVAEEEAAQEQTGGGEEETLSEAIAKQWAGTENTGVDNVNAQADNVNDNANGGIANGAEYGTERAAAARIGGQQLRTGGNGLLYGSGQRNDGTGTGKQAGSLAGGAGAAAQGRGLTADQLRTQNQRNALGTNLRLEKVSSISLGIASGTDTPNLQVIPQESWDQGMAAKAQQIREETGKQIQYVLGKIQVRGVSGGAVNVKGVITGDGIIVQANNTAFTAEQIADHEGYHGLVDRAKENGVDLNEHLVRRIREQFTEEEFDRVAEKYILALRETIDVQGAQTGEEFQERMNLIVEEILADARAGMNAFGAGATRFTDTVNEFLEESGITRNTRQENGTEESTGPPAGERFSYAGENAATADLDALARAKEMQEAGVADETIRQQTGWFTGMDGKWRFEIDDSGMQYTQRGDLNFRERNPGYARYRELLDKSNRYVLELSDEAPTDSEKAELKRLSGIWSGTFQKPGRVTEDALPQTLLSSYLKHDALFEAYPQLRSARLRFVDLREGVRGRYDADRNEIILSEELRRAPEDTLIHEIQHVIQNTEGFASGASPEFWEGQEVAKAEYADAVEKAQERVNRAEAAFRREWPDDINLNLAKRYIELGDQIWNEDMDPDTAQEIEKQQEQIELAAIEGGWGDLFDEYYYAAGELDMAKYRAKLNRRSPLDLYRNTAGEIEARDAAARRKLTAEQRRETAPDLGDELTVFVEDSDELNLRLGDRFSVDDADSHGHSLTPEQQEYFAQSQARDSSGRLLVLYHQTDGDFTIFDTRHPGAGSKDGDTPFGIFLKRSAGDIGLAGKKQMALYANITKPLRAASREDLAGRLREISESYASVSDEHKQLDAEYHEKFEQAKRAWRDYIVEWRAANPDAKRSDLYDDPKFNELFDAEDTIVDEWTEAADLLSTQAKEAITEDIRKAGYDGIFLENDAGSWGRQTDAIIALDPQQVKNISNKTPTNDPDIRYSVDDTQTYVEDVDDLGLQLGDRFSVDDADDQVAVGDLQSELYQLQNQRRTMLEADPAYAAAADDLRYANTFTEKVAARKAMAAAKANIDTAGIEQRISELNEQISEIRNRETRQHREDQEKYSGTKTAGYSTMPDTRLKELDQDYMKAVRSGDRARMAELVEQAAEAAMPASVVRDKVGRLLKVYHHTGNRFTIFDRNMARTGTEMDGFFFAPDPDSTSEYGSNMITAYLNITKLAMDPKLDRKFNDSGTLLREKLAYQGYDGMARTEDGEIYEYMTFDPEQIKSADPVVHDDSGRVIPLSERFNFWNPDIRYSVDDEGTQQTQEQKPKAAKKVTKPVAESRPIIATRDLKNHMMNLFSIPEGQRAELGTMVENYAARLIKNGQLTEEDRKHFFDRMYESGVMTVPADDYQALARSAVTGGRIYVRESVKQDFGDDWNDFRRRAFAAGVYLVNDRSASGIDQWNAELSSEDMLAGYFDAEETDERTILEKIIQVAEEGKDEHLSLAGYTARLAGREGISEDEFLDNMERQMDWALRTFAEKADLEVKLRDRTGVKIAQERQRSGERMTRQKAREAQRRADERQARKDMARRQRERKELRELQQKTLKQLRWLQKNRNRAPEELRSTWDEVLGDIDLYAASAADEMRWSERHQATWKDLSEMYKAAKENDPNFLPSQELERIVTRLDGKKIADMDLGALEDLYKAAVGLRTEFYNRNNVINDETHRLFAEVYADSKQEIESAPGGFTGKGADKLMNLQQLTPMNVLERMGGWDPNGAFYSMAKQLERGERDQRAYTVKANRMLQEFLTENEDWVKRADGQGKDAIWYEIKVPELLELHMGDKPIFGDTVSVWMTPAQKVHMYLESKNLDNLRHMTGGRTFADKELYSQGQRQEAFAQGKTIRMAPETVKAVTSDLTAEEMELARILEQYYNTFATQEINRVSNILYGYDKAMGRNYAPIYTNNNYTKSEFGMFDVTAEGVGNLKGRQHAKNPSYNIGAFDAFERHVNQTARFVGMAIPTRNWTNLMGWQEKSNSTGDVITHKWGEEGKRYITDLITTLQGGEVTKTDVVSSGVNKLQSNYITAVFGANPSIVLKQLGSIPMASAYLGAKNAPSINQVRNIDRDLIVKYTQDLEWRTMGYSMPETKTLKENPNWTQTNKFLQFTFGGGAITAMDGWAASTLWPWAENKVRREHPDLEVGTQAQIDAGESPFYKKVAEEFEDAVARSQSTSDEIHQSTLRKSKNPITRAFTLFRSDSAQSYNAIRQKIGEARYAMRSGDADTIKAAKKAAGSAFAAVLLNAAWSEAVGFLMALWKNKGKKYRDDDDELNWESVCGEMAQNMIGSVAGTVIGGEELYELIGNIITGDTWYGIDTPGMEQLNDVVDAIKESGGGMRDLIADAVNVVGNGGSLGQFFSQNSGELMGYLKDIAQTAATYLGGISVSNLEAYLLGAFQWVAPELAAAYEELFSTSGKSDLSGLEGDALSSKLGTVLDNRDLNVSDKTVAALAKLYEAGYTAAVPGDAPSSVSVDGASNDLDPYQQQTYGNIWNSIVADALGDIVSSELFAGMDQETQAKTLKRLYDYAADTAKAELFDCETESGTQTIDELKAAGLDLADCIGWASATSGMKNAEKYAELLEWDMSDKAKKAVMGTIIGTDLETESGNETEYARMQQALKEGLSMDEYLRMRLDGVNTEDFLELTGGGMDDDLAYDFVMELNEAEEAAGEEGLEDVDRWRVCVDFSSDVEDQLAALSMIMSDSQMISVEVANTFGVSPDTYVSFCEIRSQYDADGNGHYTQAEVKAVIDGRFRNLSSSQKAVLWQVMCSTTSAKNNPYSQSVGQKVLDAKAKMKGR